MTEMTQKVTQRELRTKSGKILRALDGGQEFVVTRRGKPVGELLPYKRRYFMPASQFIAVFRNAPHIDYEEFRADIDRYVDQDPTPRF
jgi:prevent-host-death family protein